MKKLDKLSQRDKALATAVLKKIRQITRQDAAFVEHLKNLRGPMKQYKRVHIGSHVLTFKVEGDQVVFVQLLHHDETY